jgi:hypothetical protein
MGNFYSRGPQKCYAEVGDIFNSYMMNIILSVNSPEPGKESPSTRTYY